MASKKVEKDVSETISGLSDEIVRETIGYMKRRTYVSFLFFALIIIPFAFAVINFTSLRDCQSKPSNGCPQLYTNS